MPIRNLKLTDQISAYTYGNTNVLYSYYNNDERSRKRAYNKVLKYMKAIYASKRKVK